MQDFRKLIVWQKAHALSLRVDDAATHLRRKKPALANQMERAADSVPANIAEGSASSTDAEFARYVTLAIKSVTELENHVERGHDGRLLSAVDYEDMVSGAIEVRRMLIGLRKRLRGNDE